MTETCAPQSLTQTTQEKLNQFVGRIEALTAERDEMNDSIKEVYDEAKMFGLDKKALRSLISMRKKDRRKREEEEAILELYAHATGDL